MRARLAITIGTVLGVAGAAPAAAFHAPHDEGLPNVDRRAAERAPVPAATRAARVQLERRLGAQATVATDRASGAIAYVGRSDGLLTGRSERDPEQVARAWVRVQRAAFGLSDRDLANLRVVARSTSPDGITHLRFNQVLDGLLAFDSGLDAHVTADGRLINVSGAPVPGARLEESGGKGAAPGRDGTSPAPGRDGAPDAPDGASPAPAPATTPALSARAGLREARVAIDGDSALPAIAGTRSGAARTTTFASGEQAVLRWSATADGPRLAWSVVAHDGDGHTYDVLLDADSGELLRRQGLTEQLGAASWFRTDPDTAPATQITMPPAWYDEHAGGTRLWGRYARTYDDSGDVNPVPGREDTPAVAQIPASGGAPNAPDWLHPQATTNGGAFPGALPCPAATGCTWDRNDPASSAVNRAQVGTNVHVLASRFHDHLAQAPIGFDEASGNFQRVNTTGAGFANDYVRAEVNDGRGFNNANFSTPPDGTAPLMQMYRFQPRGVNGGDVADIVYHEYGHGLSNRLVVNASGSSTLASLQPRMMGEAWSDFYALDLQVDEGDVIDTPAPGELTVGDYAVGPGGVRDKPADCPVDASGATAACNGWSGSASVDGGYTYGDLAVTLNTTPHNGGEVWGELLWDIRTALGRDTALTLITGGMRLSADDPSMLDMRDAILQQAIATRSAPGAADDHYVRLWRLFAARGMGGGATTPTSNATNPAESDALPAGIATSGRGLLSDPYPGGDNDGLIEAGERFELRQPVTGFGVVDLPGVTGALSGPAEISVEQGSSGWPLLGLGRQALNTTPLSGRVAAGACHRPLALTVAVSSAEGPASTQVQLDPRPSTNAVVPLADMSDGIPGVTTADFELRGAGLATDVDLVIGELRHSYLGDLRIELLHDGVTAVVLDRLGAGNYAGQDILDATFDSDAATPPPTSGPGPISGTLQPQSATALDAFDGRPVAGTWTLRITDGYAADSGELRRWGIASPQAGCGRLEIPAARTTDAAGLTPTGATLAGAVTPNGRATGIRFAWGTSAAYGETTALQAAGAGDQPVAASAPLSALAPGTTYHYRVEAIRESGQVAVAGEHRTFTTPAAAVDPGPGPGPGGGPGPILLPPPPIAPPDTVAPRITRARATVAGARRAGARRAAARRAVTLAFALDEPATVTAVVTRSAGGIRAGRRCVAVPRRRPRKARACTRWIAAGSARATVARAGAARLRLPRALARGSYRVTLTARDVAGNRTPRPTTIRFRVR